MDDVELVAFLQWALPQRGLRWRSYRRVRRQVRKRLARRIASLGLDDLAAYRRLLEADQDSCSGEWLVLDGLCRITISRFMRDRGVFTALHEALLPASIERVVARGDRRLAIWSAGCASGEEPYSLAILWRCGGLGDASAGIELSVTATDADPRMLARARAARYSPGSTRELPEAWRQAAFELQPGGELQLRAELRRMVAVLEPQDVRQRMPAGRFDLVLCRNLAFTYFDEATQRTVLDRITERLHPGGLLLIGAHEKLPPHDRWQPATGGGVPIYQLRAGGAPGPAARARP